MIIINVLARPQAHAVNLSRPNASHFLVELRSGTAKSCRCDYLDRFRKPDGKGRKVRRRDVTAGRRQVDTFPPVCVEPATSRASEWSSLPLSNGGQSCGPSVTRLRAHGRYTRAIGHPSSYRHIRINIWARAHREGVRHWTVTSQTYRVNSWPQIAQSESRRMTAIPVNNRGVNNCKLLSYGRNVNNVNLNRCIFVFAFHELFQYSFTVRERS